MLNAHECQERASAYRDAAAFLLGGAGLQRHELARQFLHDAQRYERLGNKRDRRTGALTQRIRAAWDAMDAQAEGEA